MPSLRDIRRRIASIRNTQQITRAMKMVAAAKLRTAQEEIWAARPYAHKMQEATEELVLRADPEHHPLLERRKVKRSLGLVVTTERGLCGALNANLLKRVEEQLVDGGDVSRQFIVIGRKGRDFFRRRSIPILKEYGQLHRNASIYASEIGGMIVSWYKAEEYDQVLLIYNRFRSALHQVPVMDQLLPIPIMRKGGEAREAGAEFLYEPSPQVVLEHLLHRYIVSLIYTAFLDALASEHGARMRAMDNATTNAGEMIERLTLTYHRLRQAAITKEIIEVVSGAEALSR